MYGFQVGGLYSGPMVLILDLVLNGHSTLQDHHQNLDWPAVAFTLYIHQPKGLIALHLQSAQHHGLWTLYVGTQAIVLETLDVQLRT